MSAIAQNTFTVEIGPPGMGNPFLDDVPGLVAWASVPDGTPIPYSLQSNPPFVISETGIGTKITAVGQAMLQRVAAAVSSGTSGPGLLTSISCAAYLTYSIPGISYGSVTSAAVFTDLML
jgi:hypothetical protein